MTPTEFEDYRRQLGVTPAKLAATLGVTRATVYNLIAGRVPVRPAMANLVTWLAALRELAPDHPSLPPAIRAANDNTPARKERAA